MLNPDWNDEQIKDYLRQLDCWSGEVQIEPLVGGLCNKSFVVTDNDDKAVARIGTDILVHNITQTAVQTSMRSAAEIGVTPKLRYSESNLAIVDFLPGGCIKPEDIIDNEENCTKIVELLKRLHQGSVAVHGPLTYFWPFQVVRQYIQIGTEKNSRLLSEFPRIIDITDRLEASIEPFQAVFTHNDTVPQNFMFDQERNIWLIDWDYGGYGHPVFDLVGVGCNSDANEQTEQFLYETYFGGEISNSLAKQINAFKLILNLREYMWGMVQEVTSELDSENVAASMSELYPGQEAGYDGYTNLNRDRFEMNYSQYEALF